MTAKKAKITLPLQLTFLIFSMVLNCMSIIILQLSSENITYNELGFLESFKDLPIAFISLFAVNFINKLGTKQTLIGSVFFVAMSSLLLPFVDTFWFYKIWFSIIGVCFALGKICVYSIIRTEMIDEKNLTKTMNRVEASFMIGVFIVNIGFGWLISSKYEEFWKFGFLPISLLCFVTLYLFSKIEIDSSKNISHKMLPDLSGFYKAPIVLFFAVIFFIVFTEQSFNSWLPAFYKDHLKVNSFFALQASSSLALFSFIGRYITSRIIHRFSLHSYFFVCVFFIIILLSIITVIQFYFIEKSNITLFMFPLIGLFLSPLYPVISSKMLSGIDKAKANTLTSLIVIFSSLGSSICSIFISILFERQMLMYYSIFILVSAILILSISWVYFKTSLNKI